MAASRAFGGTRLTPVGCLLLLALAAVPSLAVR